MPIDEDHQRSMDTYYDNRAFVGAPPNIPHPVSNERSMGANTCLKCHENGGYVEKFEAYAPVTPHPDYLNCRQCHVAKNTDGLFVESNFEKGAKPAIGTNNALPGSPPAIPHRLQLRENCLACHAGPAAPKEIRVTHPERVNCRQCHAAQNQLPEDFGTFTRKVTTDE
jgi:cytochrome c-type protein NapB